MYTDEQLEQLEMEEREITDEAILAILLLLTGLQGNLENELRKFYQKYGKDGVVTYSEAMKYVSDKDHRRRIIALYLIMDKHFKGTRTDVKIRFEKSLKDIIKSECEFFDVDLDIEKILDKIWGSDDSNWEKRLFDDFNYYEKKLLSTIKKSMIRGDSIDETIDELEKVIKSFGKSQEALVITESTTVNSFARKDAMKFKGAKKYKFYAMQDERTCSHCGSLHGLVFPMSQFEIGVTASPIHPRCRCLEIPII